MTLCYPITNNLYVGPPAATYHAFTVITNINVVCFFVFFWDAQELISNPGLQEFVFGVAKRQIADCTLAVPPWTASQRPRRHVRSRTCASALDCDGLQTVEIPPV